MVVKKDWLLLLGRKPILFFTYTQHNRRAERERHWLSESEMTNGASGGLCDIYILQLGGWGESYFLAKWITAGSYVREFDREISGV